MSKISNVYSMVMMISIFISAMGLHLIIIMQSIKKRHVRISDSGHRHTMLTIRYPKFTLNSYFFSSFVPIFFFKNLLVFESQRYMCQSYLFNSLISPVLRPILVSCKRRDSAAIRLLALTCAI